MNLAAYRMKLTEIHNRGGEDSPRYSLSYKPVTLKNTRPSYDILSAIIGKDDVVIELNTDMYCMKPDRDYAGEFLDAITRLNLEYSHKAVSSQKKTAFFGFSLDSKRKAKADEILAYVPNNIWSAETFGNSLPAGGARYYVTKEPADGKSIINAIPGMTEEEKASVFKLIAFDMAGLGQMGISSDYLSLEDLNKLLGL